MKTDGIPKLSQLLRLTSNASKPTQASATQGKDEFIRKHSSEFFKRFNDQRLSEQDLIVNLSSQSHPSSLTPWWSLEQEKLLPTMPTVKIKSRDVDLKLLHRLKELATDKSYLQVNLFDILPS